MGIAVDVAVGVSVGVAGCPVEAGEEQAVRRAKQRKQPDRKILRIDPSGT